MRVDLKALVKRNNRLTKPNNDPNAAIRSL